MPIEALGISLDIAYTFAEAESTVADAPCIDVMLKIAASLVASAASNV